MSVETVLIIGGGQAGAQTATSLRQFGFEGKITLVGDEPALPYQRPPLSKAYLKGELEQERLYLKNSQWYETQNVDVLTDTAIVSVDVGTNTAQTQTGKQIKFDHLVFATGSRNRTLPMEGSKLERVFGLRNLADVAQNKFVSDRLVQESKGRARLSVYRYGVAIPVIIES